MGDFKEKFIQDFITDNRWKFLLNGLGTTLSITVLALVFGSVLGLVIGIIRCAHDQQSANDRKGINGVILGVFNFISKLYVTIIRGTPVLVQLLIMYFIIMVSCSSKLWVAVVTFTINSGAYVSEIFRGAIMSVDKGQMEAGRSLGLNYVQTMVYVVIPQAIKSCLPALVNELITLLKETSICGYIGLNELTRGGDIIRGTTFDAFLPLFGVAIIYLIIVLLISYFMSILERRLRKSDVR